KRAFRNAFSHCSTALCKSQGSKARCRRVLAPFLHAAPCAEGGSKVDNSTFRGYTVEVAFSISLKQGGERSHGGTVRAVFGGHCGDKPLLAQAGRGGDE